MTEEVILVDREDRAIGSCEKLQCHREGHLHRAFSIFIQNSQKELLLHQRALGKYHSGGLWTNACCSHPRPGEAIEDAARRRLQEELGIGCPLKKAFTFTYCVEVGQGLIEHEYDHVFHATFDGPLDNINPQEVAACRWISLPNLLKEISSTPEHFTPWFRLALPKLLNFLPK